MPSLQNQTLLANGISGTIWPDSPKSDLTKGVNSKETGNEGELSTCFAIRQQSQTMKRTLGERELANLIWETWIGRGERYEHIIRAGQQNTCYMAN
jgi:hypothetical protein